MRRRIPPAILSAAAGLVLLWYAGESSAQFVLATGADADITEDGLHRVDPLIMEAAWVKPDLDLSRYTRILLMPTAVQFRDVPDRQYDPHSGTSTTYFALDDDRKEWLRRRWRRAVDARFAHEQSNEQYEGGVADVLVVQGFLVDVVSRIPADYAGSSYTLVRDPWSVAVVLELRDAATAELLARTIDRRNAQGLLDVSTVWYRTEELLERWAQVLADRLDQLSELGGRDSSTPAWAR
jgi:hypothetical protein